ncbi:MAG TPA: DivIVA domain-containing protein [Acidimicrobiales bacterium]|nr:DivIVA domain-containing protein [Acidimicrobiales bacterium]
MEVSPKTLREVEFREKMRGYHPEDVDHFLEQVAAGLEVMQERLRQAVERAQRAEVAAAEAGGSDETLRKTLVLAQRTADMAVQEAREQAARILAGAEQQAQGIIAEAEERGRKALEDAVAESRAELSRLEAARGQSQQDVETLERWVEEHKSHLQVSLSEALASVERVGVLWPAPNTRPADVPPPAAQRPSPPPPQAEIPSEGPETMAWSPGDEGFDSEDMRRQEAAVAAQSFAPPLQAGVVDVRPNDAMGGPDERAMDDFFDDSDELGDDDRRFGGRLRRRR